MEQRFRQVSSSHPRLFFRDTEKAALQAKINGDWLLKAVFEQVRAGADAMCGREPLKREMRGRRLSSAWRCHHRVAYLAFMFRMTGERAYLNAAKQDMLEAAAFEDWNPSHFLDVAELTTALAVGYDWLYNELEPDARQQIRSAIVEKGLRTSLKPRSWSIATNNWNQVCHGGLVLGALAVLEDEPELAEQVIVRALRAVPRAMAEYEPDGVHPEGPGYWRYGTSYNLLLIDALESVLGSDFGLTKSQGFMNTGEFYLHAAGPTGLFFNYSDSSAGGGVTPAMHWFAARKGAPSLLWQEKEELARIANAETSSGERMLPFLLLWAEPVGDIPEPARLHWQGDGRTPVAFHRSGWDPEATFVAIKGGSASTSHAHMDAGSFVLDMEGVRWALDLGAQSYNSLESLGINLWDKTQNSERWTVFRLNNFSHNTLVVDSQLQQFRGNAPIVAFSDDKKAPYTIVDLTPVYEGQLARVRRGVRLAGRSVLVQDELEMLEHSTTVRWGMATHADVMLSGDRTAMLKQDGRTIALRVLAPKDVALTIYDMEVPPQEYDAKNPNTRMVGFEVAIGPGSAEMLAVFLEPGAGENDTPAVIPLENW
jgi:hypothetical protein